MRLAPQALSALLGTADATLINVHVPYDGEIDGTDLFIRFDQIAGRTADLPAKNQPIILYCRTGRMSAIAAETLVGLGYTNVTELAGGMEAWTASGLPLQSRPPG
jgi:rhodanese-related sulfurtransferase